MLLGAPWPNPRDGPHIGLVFIIMATPANLLVYLARHFSGVRKRLGCMPIIRPNDLNAPQCF